MNGEMIVKHRMGGSGRFAQFLTNGEVTKVLPQCVSPETINKPLGGVGWPAGPSIFIQKPVTCAAVFELFGTKSFLTELPGREP